MQPGMADFTNASFRPHGPVSFRPTRDTDWAYACIHDHSDLEDTTFREAFDAYKDVVTIKKAQLAALSDVVNSETLLLKKSALVTAIGLGGAFVLSCICWIVINAAIGVALDRADVHLGLTTLALLALNGVMIAFFVRMVLTSYKHVTIGPLMSALLGEAGVTGPESKEDR